MTESDKPRFGELVAALAAAFGREVDEATILAYWIGLRDMLLERLCVGVERAIRSARFMPSPAELRELSGELSGRQRAVMAWIAVCDAAGRVGSYRSVDFDDQVINATVRSMGGWPELLSRTGDEFDKWARAEFLKTYEALTSATIGDAELMPLAGMETTGAQPKRIGVSYETERRRLRCVSAESTVEAIPTQRSGACKVAPRELLHLRNVPQ